MALKRCKPSEYNALKNKTDVIETTEMGDRASLYSLFNKNTLIGQCLIMSKPSKIYYEIDKNIKP